jgi:hypothetical protein
MTVLTAEDVGGRHAHLAEHRPEWRRSMWSIRNDGGPWACPVGHASLLIYRCSVCGRDLATLGSGATIHTY